MIADRGGSSISFDILAGSTPDDDEEDEEEKDSMSEMKKAAQRVAHLEMPWLVLFMFFCVSCVCVYAGW